jgi:rare lipoprotein A
VQYGYASYYGEDFHGRKTASGEKYDMYELTCAHKTLPFNTKVKVTNLTNKKTVTVRVNDRGPFVSGRIIDLSYAAARKIGLIPAGVTRVKIEVMQ